MRAQFRVCWRAKAPELLTRAAVINTSSHPNLTADSDLPHMRPVKDKVAREVQTASAAMTTFARDALVGCSCSLAIILKWLSGVYLMGEEVKRPFDGQGKAGGNREMQKT